MITQGFEHAKWLQTAKLQSITDFRFPVSTCVWNENEWVRVNVKCDHGLASSLDTRNLPRINHSNHILPFTGCQQCLPINIHIKNVISQTNSVHLHITFMNANSSANPYQRGPPNTWCSSRSRAVLKLGFCECSSCRFHLYLMFNGQKLHRPDVYFILSVKLCRSVCHIEGSYSFQFSAFKYFDTMGMRGLFMY